MMKKVRYHKLAEPSHQTFHFLGFCPPEFPFSTNFGRVCCNHRPTTGMVGKIQLLKIVNPSCFHFNRSLSTMNSVVKIKAFNVKLSWRIKKHDAVITRVSSIQVCLYKPYHQSHLKNTFLFAEYVFLPDVDSSYDSLWLKTMQANLFIANHSKLNFDFVVKVRNNF